ncbi:MAG: hypothetical protein LEGION0403_FIIPPAGN_02376 [Legionella sp.]|uniref:YopJ family acetyltransferase n=1 Tax=Legionella sp. TaxID=459 RepID=UPI003D0EDB1D
MKDHQEIINEFRAESSLLSVDAMKVAIESTQKQQSEKNRTFNCDVLNIDVKNPNLDEFPKLLERLNSEKAKDERFQIVLKYNDKFVGHWLTLDIQRINGELKFFVLDFANCLSYDLNILLMIEKYCPEAKISFAGPPIQRDQESCAYFSIVTAVNLSKINNLHEQLDGKESKGPLGQFRSYQDWVEQQFDNEQDDEERPFEGIDRAELSKMLSKLNYIPLGNLPKNLGSLIKHTQSIQILNSSFLNKNIKQPNGKSIEVFVSNHKKLIYDKGLGVFKEINNSMVGYKAKIKKRALTYINESKNNELTISVEAKDTNKKLDPLTTENPKMTAPTYLSNDKDETRLAQMAKVIDACNKLNEKRKQFDDNVDAENQDTKDAMNELLGAVNPFLKRYFHDPNYSFEQYKQDTQTALEGQHDNIETLQKHRGVAKNLIVNLLAALTGIGLIIIVSRSIYNGQLTLFKTNTDSANRIENFKEAINNVEAISNQM